MQNEQQHSPQFIRQRRFLVAIPALVLPFLTFMFWALGGGRSTPAIAQQKSNGLNTQLPGAHLKDGKPQSKLSYYEQASADSLRLQQQIKNDPYYHPADISDTSLTRSADTLAALAGHPAAHGKATSQSEFSDPNEAKVYRKLARLNAAINTPQATTGSMQELQAPAGSSDADKLEQMMGAMEQDKTPDPEMDQINGMLGKILDIQHPELVKERLRQQSAAQRGSVFPVAATQAGDPVSIIRGTPRDTAGPGPENTGQLSRNGFYSIGENTGDDLTAAIEATVHETQTLVTGSTVKLRLTNDVYINGTCIPRNTFVYGVAQLAGERLTMKIASIRYHNALFPVELSVYDMDGLSGLYIPGAITRDVAKASGDRSLQEVAIPTMDPSLGAQAASAGITAAKTLFSKKVRLIKVTVKAGYKVLLYDEKQKSNH